MKPKPYDPEADYFEIYETGDPYGTTWDATHYANEAEWKTGSGVFRGDLGYRFRKRELVAYLRKQYPGCVIRNRDSGRLIRS
jgi:hypothetical protein